MILGLGIPEILIILVIVLVIFGPKNLPKLGKSLGKTVKNIREGMEEVDDNGNAVSDTAAEVVEDITSAAEGGAVDEVEDTAPAESEGDSVFCSHCGAKNPADVGFCSKCGTKLSK